MIALKPGVRVLGMKPEILLAIVVAGEVWKLNGLDLVVTSVVDGRHSAGSLHYGGMAVDLRIPADPSDRAKLRSQMTAALGPDFDVVLEVDHIHIEFQPKVPL